MGRLTHLTIQEKREALRNSIRNRCHYGISSRRLNEIIDNINVNRTYFIKTTTDPEKFLNIVAEEFVFSSDRKVMSYVKKLYGNFDAGSFYKINDRKDYISSKLHEMTDAAAIKQTITEHKGQSTFVTYTIVVFESGTS